MPATAARLFVGLRVEIGLARALRAQIDALLPAQPNAATSAGTDGLRWSAPQDYHITLCFLGQVEAADRERLTAELERATQALSVPRLRLARTGAFPVHGSPRVLWAGVEECAGSIGSLAVLREHVERGVRTAGLGFQAAEREGAWTPHVTLARVGARAAPDMGWFQDLRPAGVFEARAIELCQTAATAKGGGRYPALREFELLRVP